MEEELEETGSMPGNSCIAAIIENRAKEVGIAVFGRHQLKLNLLQLVETSRTYTTTANLLASYQPSLLVTVATTQEVLHGANEAARAVPQVCLPRGAFDDTKAALALEQFATAESYRKLEGLRHSYYLAMGACGALLRFIQEEEHVMLAAGSLVVDTVGLQHHMLIDPGTVQTLELIKQRPGSPPLNAKEGTLFRWLNRTKTLPGARLLKANILQPLTDAATLKLRQDTVEEMLGNQELAFNAAQGLAQLPANLDRLCSSLALIPKSTGAVAKRIGTIIQAVILLRETLAALPSLAEGLEAGTSDLVRSVRKNLQHPAFAEMLGAINEVLDDETQANRHSFVNRTQHCFAVRNGADGLLDVARAAFCRVTEETHALVASYREQARAEIKIKYTDRQGFHLSQAAPGTETKKGTAGDLPPRFLQLQSRGRKEVHYTTHELNALNTRLQSAANDCMILTLQVLDGMRSRILDRVVLLHKLTDNLALLDMLCALAAAVQDGAGEYVRPRCTEGGPIAIVQGRHPLLERAEGIDFQPNDLYLADCSSFHIIGGPNMSGKSTYLRQAALIVILAQIGCFVPAKFASLRCVDRLFTRIGTGDSIENNSSSFMEEMQETAFALHNATDRSLVLIDELGRATSTSDGIGIAWTVAEHLITHSIPTLFATHFARLGELASLYPNCKLWHFDVDTQGRLDFKWQLKPGSDHAMHYGLLLAPLVGIPEKVLSEAERVAHAVQQRDTRTARTGSSAKQRQLEAIYSLAHKIICVAYAWAENPHNLDVCQQLTALKKEAKRIFPEERDAARGDGADAAKSG